MSPRDTGTGKVLEDMILSALKQGGYDFKTQQKISDRPGGHRHFVDAIAEREGKRFLISLKWQQTSGTAEQKVPFEVISLADAVQKGNFTKAYLVLGGDGWTLREFYTGGGLKAHLVDSDKVQIVTFERFVGEANRGAL